jgi:carbonic anhydrase
MEALYRDVGEFEEMPHLKDWLKIAAPVKDVVNSFYHCLSRESCQRITEEENILAQLRNIETYPFVAKALNEGTLHLHGWYYEIGTGEVYSYNPAKDAFEKIIYREGKDE